VQDVGFRTAVASDALCIGVLATQVFLDTYATDGVRASLAREVLEHLSTPAVTTQLRNPCSRFVLAERGGHLLGFAQLTLGAVHELVTHGPMAELDRLYVQERFTSLGIGKALLSEAELLAAREGAATLWLTSWVGNKRALAFYAKRGYTDRGATNYTFQGEQYENRVFAKGLQGRS
jgi:GNAT superfamily N-acetyltransferase